MDYTNFYERCKQVPEKEIKFAETFCNLVEEIFAEENCSYLDIERISRLFYGHGSSLSKSQFYRQRKFILMFYGWLQEQGLVDQEGVDLVHSLKLGDVVLDYELNHYYFSSLDRALDFVRLIGAREGMGDYDDLLNIKTIVILTWHGVKLPELLEVKKGDLHPDVEAVTVGERTVKLQTEYFNILRRFSELDMHKGFPSQKKQVYVASTYLMRSAKQDCMSYNNAQKALQRFNAVAILYGKELSILNLRRNGIFVAAYQATDDKTVNTLIQELTACDTAFAFGYKEFYGRWKNLFFGGDND